MFYATYHYTNTHKLFNVGLDCSELTVNAIELWYADRAKLHLRATIVQ